HVSLYRGTPCRPVPHPIYSFQRTEGTWGMNMQLTLPPKVTARAFARLHEIGANQSGKALRVAVDGGGCSGFQYDISLDDPAEGDLVLEGDGEQVVIDEVSLPFLADAVIDFTEE